jgi:serine/threonine protein kinase
VDVETWLLRRIGLETASGLAFLHESRYLHRDVKAANVLLTDSFHAKVADFGLVKFCQVASHDAEHTMGIGTDRYTAPEVSAAAAIAARHRGAAGGYSQAADVFSFGVLLWELLHVRGIFEARRGRQVREAHERGERAAIDLPSDRAQFATLIACCWAHAPGSRPSMAAVVDAMLVSSGNASASQSQSPSSSTLPMLALRTPSPSSPLGCTSAHEDAAGSWHMPDAALSASHYTSKLEGWRLKDFVPEPSSSP